MMAPAAILPGLRMPALALPGTGGRRGRSRHVRRPAWSRALLLPARQPARRPAAAGLGPDPRRARRHWRKPAISATAISAWPRSAPSCSGSAPRPQPAQRGSSGHEAASALRAAQRRLASRLTEALGLPTFAAGGLRLLRRLTLGRAARRDRGGVLSGLPAGSESAAPVIDWLARRQTG